MPRSAVAVALALLLAVAGCNAPLADKGGPAETATVTSAPLPGASAESGGDAPAGDGGAIHPGSAPTA